VPWLIEEFPWIEK